MLATRWDGFSILRRSALLMLLGLLALLGVVRAAAAADPPLTVPRAKLDKGLTCPAGLAASGGTPVLLVTGTGIPSSNAWGWGFQRALAEDGHRSCVVDFPSSGTGDLQISTQYVVHAIRRMRAMAGRPIGVYGISLGAVLPRLALTFWPGTRALVTDVVALAGPQHGTTRVCAAVPACPPAVWQQGRGARLLDAMNRRADESPGPAAWTTVRSVTDAVAVPAKGPAPTSALRGASNVVIQHVCPGRVTEHIAIAFDSVSYAALLDALAHPGGARPSALPADVCATAFAPRLDQALVVDRVRAAAQASLGNMLAGPMAAREPPLRPPFSGRAAR